MSAASSSVAAASAATDTPVIQPAAATAQPRIIRDVAYAPDIATSLPRGDRKLDLFVAPVAAPLAATAAPAMTAGGAAQSVNVSAGNEAAAAGIEADASVRPRPLLVFIHGGLWVDRDKSGYSFLGEHWSATFGVHVAVVNYRLSNTGGAGVRHPAHTDDVMLALRWLASAAAQQEHRFAVSDLILVGHSCGAHIAGLIALAEPNASLLTELAPALEEPAQQWQQPQVPATNFICAALSLLRGCVGIEGIFDCARFAADFPDWSSGITDAFGPEPAQWESPQDYLPLPPQETQQLQRGAPVSAGGKDSASAAGATAASADASESRVRIQSLLSDGTLFRRRRVPWLVIHSPEDPWVNLAQADRFHAALRADEKNMAAMVAAAGGGFSNASSSGSVVTAAATVNSSSSTLSLVSGAHFVVVERVGGPQDEVTPLLRDFLTRCTGKSSDSSNSSGASSANDIAPSL
jgi:dienelactone hydrolase